jgi:hypothetical protein
MIRELPDSSWDEVASRLRGRRGPTAPVIPDGLPIAGVLEGPYDYGLDDDVLRRLQAWLQDRGETRVHYFLTEGVGGGSEARNFEIDLWDLTQESLSRINSGYCSLLVSPTLHWAIYADDEGRLHVAGPADLLERLRGR